MKKFIILITTIMAMLLCLSSFNDDEPIDKAGLGKLLFFDPLFSKNKTISCASYHKPEFAFADTLLTVWRLMEKRTVKEYQKALSTWHCSLFLRIQNLQGLRHYYSLFLNGWQKKQKIMEQKKPCWKNIITNKFPL